MPSASVTKTRQEWAYIRRYRGVEYGPISLWQTEFCTLFFLTDSAANKILKDFRIFLEGNEWHHQLEEEQLGCCMILIDQVAVKKKCDQKKITHTPQLHQIMSQPIYKNNLSNGGMSLVPITKITKQQFVTRACLKSSAVNRGKLRKFSLSAGYTSTREEAVHLLARMPNL